MQVRHNASKKSSRQFAKLNLPLDFLKHTILGFESVILQRKSRLTRTILSP